jgi:crossover junction endodeoxyribonuclease RuvC
MRVLGVDCGTENTGWGVIDTDGRAHRLVTWGVIHTSPKSPLADRLCRIAAELGRAVAEHRPDSAAIEDVFHSVNAKSALKLAHVRGVAMAVIAGAGVPLGEYSPLAVKTSVVGYGRAEKGQVAMMVRSLLRLEAEITARDATDALAVAICHATRS